VYSFIILIKFLSIPFPKLEVSSPIHFSRIDKRLHKEQEDEWIQPVYEQDYEFPIGH